jgi:hypothetical protein
MKLHDEFARQLDALALLIESANCRATRKSADDGVYAVGSAVYFVDAVARACGDQQAFWDCMRASPCIGDLHNAAQRLETALRDGGEHLVISAADACRRAALTLEDFASVERWRLETASQQAAEQDAAMRAETAALLQRSADAIEQLTDDVARLESENAALRARNARIHRPAPDANGAPSGGGMNGAKPKMDAHPIGEFLAGFDHDSDWAISRGARAHG